MLLIVKYQLEKVAAKEFICQGLLYTANAQPGSIAPPVKTNWPLLCYADNFLCECAMQ